MSSLAQATCEPCASGTPPLDSKACKTYQAALPEWQIIDHDGIMKLTRRFTFRNFADALTFTQRVGELAEQAGHHPSIVIEWGKATVTWWSHDIKGLHLNDFILAARTDEVAE
ncbi:MULTISPECIES: 4a-hydroxytetrahydrobiopterin dehydratase [unclassified Halomonas]|uniref:4a-hydroxytetrahydrobiopterin dehydratase n=1 Tax=unclassified Halomonas TaxID=2609666 RepID=UPI0009905185|nr:MULTISPECIES: 4a-hydroxytetrahydrobiopterin dehydratase [unclassified Halomonas]AQU82601.1 4a-hydroxytetrahydrobiopterin dehydratase [Halomonas sp. 'Soap Lake \